MTAAQRLHLPRHAGGTGSPGAPTGRGGAAARRPWRACGALGLGRRARLRAVRCPRGPARGRAAGTQLAGPRSPLSSAWESPRPGGLMTDSAEVKPSFRGRQKGPWDRARTGALSIQPPLSEQCWKSLRASLSPTCPAPLQAKNIRADPKLLQM
ncbi:hypothetical protein CapIbe_021070 [Capra ibex]